MLTSKLLVTNPDDQKQRVISAELLQKITKRKIGHESLNNLLDTIDKLAGDQDEREEYRNHLVDYASVLEDGRFKLDQYLCAVKYVSSKLKGDTNVVSYAKTFPDRYQRLLDQGKTSKDISAHVVSYNKSLLVSKVMEQSLVPVWILNADIHQKAINTQADLMQNAKSEKVRTDAANSLLTHLKRPEAQKIDLNVGIQEDKSIADLREVTAQLAKQQRELMQGGAMSATDAAEADIITDADYEEVIDEKHEPL